LFGLATFCDPRLGENESINFNAGSHADSIQMIYAAYVGYESPHMVACSKESS